MIRAFGVDIGYHTVKLHLPDGEVPFVTEPSVLALYGDDTVAACGEDALALADRVPGTVRLIHPFSGETTPEAAHAKAYFSYLIKKYRLRGSDLYFSVSGRQDDETDSVLVEAAQRAGARDVMALDPMYAAAMGCKVPAVSESAVVNIGASVSDMACFCRGKTVAQASCGYAGRAFDRALAMYLLRQYRLAVSEEEAERIKCLLGTMNPKGNRSASVTAMRAAMGLPKKKVLTAKELTDCFEKVFDRLCDELLVMIRARRPEPDRLILTGGGAKLEGLAEALSPVLGLPVVTAKEPEYAVIRGIATMIRAKRNPQPKPQGQGEGNRPSK